MVEASKDPRFLHILNQIASIIFFKTPHHGFNQDTLDVVTSRYRSGINSIPPIIEGLASGSPTPADIYSQFKRLKNEMHVLNFYASSKAVESIDCLVCKFA